MRAPGGAWGGAGAHVRAAPGNARAPRGLNAAMQLAFDGTDWSVLSHLLRCAQRVGWRIRFLPDGVEIASPQASGDVIVLPAALLRLAREAGWQVARPEPGGRGMALRHPSVHQRVRLRLGG